MPSLDTMMSYHRLKRTPLDDMEVFTDLNDLMDYCKDGARYDGQRVVVLNENFGLVKYTIKNNIPIINMNGSEPIFKSITFNGDSSATHGMLIYENNSGDKWDADHVFNFDDDLLCLLSQLEIFRILDAAGNKTFKFYIERLTRHTDILYTSTWSQNYNPYTDGINNPITNISNDSNTIINQMSYNKEYQDMWLKTNHGGIYLMPCDTATGEFNYITKIYVKAEDYYQALI